MGYPKAKSLLCVANMAYRPALLYLLSGLATISVNTHTRTNTVTYTQGKRRFTQITPWYRIYSTNTRPQVKTQTLATKTLQRNAQMTSTKSKSTMFLKRRAGRANLDTKFPKPFAWLSVMMSALWERVQQIPGF